MNLPWGILREFAKRNSRNKDVKELNLAKTALQAWGTGLALGIIGYASFQVLPLYMKSYELQYAARREARLAATNFKSNAAVQDAVYEKARELDLPLAPQQISIASSQREKPVGSVMTLMDSSPQEAETVANVSIDVAYEVPVPFPGHTFHLNFRFHVDDHST